MLWIVLRKKCDESMNDAVQYYSYSALTVLIELPERMQHTNLLQYGDTEYHRVQCDRCLGFPLDDDISYH